MQRLLLLLLSVLFPCLLHASEANDLSGTGWTFHTTLDPVRHPVTVPHTWLVTPGYERYIGHAMYERDFEMPAVTAGKIVRLRFDAVYDVAQVWVNGVHVGTHQGGYTAFEFDVTSVLHAGSNHLLVDVDNTPTLTSIPALATGVPSVEKGKPESRVTIVGWLPYGGVVRPVHLLVSDAVYFRNMKVDATPDLRTGTATLTVRAALHNGGPTEQTVQVQGSVAGMTAAFKPVRIAPHSDASATWSAKLPQAHLWSVRDPYLYSARLTIPGDERVARVGVRSVQVRGTELLLNGRVVHLNGANRVAGDDREGLLESDATITRDLSDMLADNMRMMRIAHYPQPQSVFDFADEHGMLLIPEAGNWNMSEWQMNDPGIRKLFQQQMREMMEEDWNHPSVIAWSVGNEYESYTPGGIDWTRDMRAFTLGLDTTRLITFASRYTGDPAVKTGKDEGSQYSDFVSVNIYGDYARRFDRVHELYPDKPVFVTEFGKMGEAGEHDPQRVQDITAAMNAIKTRPWMIGASLWTWNDYRSFIAGTPADGVRRWGVVDMDRRHRDSWKVVQELFKTELP